jgi:hypothetical protein
MDAYRREGMADAVVRIVLSRVAPFMRAEDWCDVLGLEQRDIKAAIERLRVAAPAAAQRLPARTPARTKPFHRKDGRAVHRPRFIKNPCPFCAVTVSHGKHWTNHMAKYHPGEWEAKIEAEMTEKYGAECPDCGERIKVTVHVERHVCEHQSVA